MIVKCRKANVSRIKINKTFHTADSFASSADKKQGTLSNLTHSLSVPKLNTDLRTRAMLNRPAVYKKTLSTAHIGVGRLGNS